VTRLKEAARALLDQLEPADRAGLITFDQSFVSKSALTGDHAAVRSAIDSIEPGGATALVDTVYAALGLAEGRGRRTLILLFTDGWDSLSWLPERVALKMARESEAVVYAVARRPRNVGSGGDAFLGELTEATGGRVVWVERVERLTETFVTMLEEMRARYLLTYAPAGVDGAGWHTLSVRLKQKRGRVTARQGYYR
jgi:VWFA-related protein